MTAIIPHGGGLYSACKFTSEEIAEEDREWASLLREAFELVRDYYRAQRRGEGTEVIRGQLLELGQCVLYACDRHRRHGAWTRYYSTPTGRVHSSLGCHTINAHTLVTCLPGLSGREPEVIALTHSLCGHCRRDMGAKEVEALRRYMLI